MPKQKTHKGTAKRFKTTGSGKLRRERANLRHNMEHMATRQTRRLTGSADVAKSDVPRIKRLLGL